MSIHLTSGARELQRFAIPILAHHILKMANHWKPLAPLLGEIDICSHPVRFFCKKFNFGRLLIKYFSI